MNTSPLRAYDRQVLEAIFKHPPARNLSWKSVIGALSQIGNVVEQHNGGLLVKVGFKHAALARPHGKELSFQEIKHLREFLAGAGIGPSEGTPKGLRTPPA